MRLKIQILQIKFFITTQPNIGPLPEGTTLSSGVSPCRPFFDGLTFFWVPIELFWILLFPFFHVSEIVHLFPVGFFKLAPAAHQPPLKCILEIFSCQYVKIYAILGAAVCDFVVWIRHILAILLGGVHLPAVASSAQIL